MGNKPLSGIYSFAVQNFRGIKHTVITDIPKGTPWIFLTGKNGFGKTSLLQSLYIGLRGNRDGHTILSTEDFEIAVDYSQGYEVGSVDKSNKVNQNTDAEYLANNVIAYGPSRILITNSESSNEAIEKSSDSYSLFHPNGVLFNIENALKNWFYRSQSKERFPDLAEEFGRIFDFAKSTLIKLSPTIADIQINIKNDTIEYFESDEDGKIIETPLRYEQLASGNKVVIAMVGDLMFRLLKAPKVKVLQHLTGIVIIDELDLHLHPDWQYKLPELLSSVFPKIQFIASTHSPIPLLGAPDGSIVLTVDRTKEEGITAKKLDVDVANLTPNLILSSEVFGFHDLIAKSNKDQQKLRTEDSYKEKMKLIV